MWKAKHVVNRKKQKQIDLNVLFLCNMQYEFV